MVFQHLDAWHRQRFLTRHSFSSCLEMEPEEPKHHLFLTLTEWIWCLNPSRAAQMHNVVTTNHEIDIERKSINMFPHFCLFSFRELPLDNGEFPAPILRSTYLHERLPPSALCLQSISPLRLMPSPGSTVLFEEPNNITGSFAGSLNAFAHLFCIYVTPWHQTCHVKKNHISTTLVEALFSFMLWI